MSKYVVASHIGVEVAKLWGIPVGDLQSLEIKIKPGHLVTVIADYIMDEETYSKFYTLMDKYVAKEDTDDTQDN